MGVKSLFNRGAHLFASRVCLQDGRTRLTYAETYARSRQIAAALQAAGMAPSAKVALLSPNCAEAMLAVLAIHQADAVFVPLNAALPAEEHATALQHLQASVLFYHSRYAAAAATFQLKCPTLNLCVCLDDGGGVGVSLHDLLQEHAVAALTEAAPNPHDLVAIYATGGSTGPPKRAMHTRLVWETMAASYLTALPITKPPTFLMAPPLTHAAGTYAMMMMPVGSTTIIQDGFDPTAVLDAIERERVTHLFLPPTAIYKLLEHPGVASRDFSSLQAFIYTAAPMSVEKLRRCIEVFGPVMVQFWGQTEAPCFCTCLPAEDHTPDDPERAQRLASCGRETVFARVEVMDDDGRILPPGSRGELVVRSNLVMSGYYANAAATEEVSRHGWHHTGDIGLKDADGYIYIVGRKSDMIITGGFNVYPADIEQVIWSHPAVEECAVIGVPDEKWGEAVVAIVQPKLDRMIEPEKLIAFCKDRLGGVRAPKRVILMEDIPRNAVGKVDKSALKEPFWRGRSRKV